MGNKPRRGPKPPPAPPAPEPSATTTYSTRFDPQQRELIEKAASVLSWSPAKFIRDAAVRRAADVVNASGGAETKLQSLASILLSHVFNPRVQVTKLDDPYDPSTQNVRVLSRDEALASRTQREFPDESYGEVSDLAPQRPHDGDLAQIRRALESGGTRFLEILLQQWDNWARGESEYAPTVSAQELLKGGDND